MIRSHTMLLLLPLSSLIVCPTLRAQNRPYTEGPVWAMTMVRTTEGMSDDYLRSLAATYKRISDEAKKQGLLLSYKIISTNASGPEDWDLLLLEEYKNWAAFDGLSDKFEPIQKKVVGDEGANRELMTKRLNVRRIVGSKVGQELFLR
jgi:hypothetical protein